jgi:hypothetical protein
MGKTLFSIGLLGLTLIVGLSAISCNIIGGGSPSYVTRQFYAALAKGDSKTISELATPQTARLIEGAREKISGLVIAKGDITNIEETIDGDTAVVRTTFKDGSTDELHLVKVGGKWKVTIQK